MNAIKKRTLTNRILHGAITNAFCFVFLVIFSCDLQPDLAGSVTEGGNVIGSIIDSTGHSMQGVSVQLFPVQYDPVACGVLPDSLADTTGKDGTYSFQRIKQGRYNVVAVHLTNRTRAMVSRVSVEEDTVTTVLPLTLQKTGAIQVVLPESVDTVNGFLYVPGTAISVQIRSGRSSIIDSVPAGTISAVYYTEKSTSESVILHSDISVVPGDTTSVLPSWSFSKRLYLNTTASGAGVSGTVNGFPALVRLTHDNFTFDQVRSGGEDLRFIKADGTPLPYEIERFDAIAEQAEIWVRLDTMFGNDSNQRIIMYWGNRNAESNSNSAGVFDTANGFIGVWHMNDYPSAGTASIRDQTANTHHATPFGSMTEANSADGAVGKALRFDGKDDYLNAGNVSIPGTYSVGLWVLLDTLGDYQRFIYKDSSYTLWYDKDSVSVRMEHFSNPTWWKGLLQDGGTRVPMTTGTWYYLIATFDGTAIRLYKNGVEVSVSNAVTIVPRTNEIPLLFGQSRNNSFVNGIMDEIRIEGAVRSPDWVRLCYMNQRIDDKLVHFK